MTVGELREQLRGIPESVPLRVLTGGFQTDRVGVGYGSDPQNLDNYVVVLDLNAREGLIT